MTHAYLFLRTQMIAFLHTDLVIHCISQQAQSAIGSVVPIKPSMSPSFDPCQDRQIDKALG
jgi:hypothetical protein